MIETVETGIMHRMCHQRVVYFWNNKGNARQRPYSRQEKLYLTKRIESDKTTSIYNVSTRVLSKK